jgi:hypothetical protein
MKDKKYSPYSCLKAGKKLFESNLFLPEKISIPGHWWHS